MPLQPALDKFYTELPESQLHDHIAATRTRLGPHVVILGHHYQRDEIIRYADFRGDSLQLSQLAAAQAEAQFIVFCGVHFMAESADILARPGQTVILPDLDAGCTMADMAPIRRVEEAWDTLTDLDDARYIPVTYINSAAAIKAFCGARNGIVCTSSNALKVFKWAFARGDKIFFLPDEHLGRNTAYRLGIDLDAMAVYDPYKPDGGLTEEDLAAARIVLWKGFCSVHQRFRPEHVALVRKQNPAINVIVHPECSFEVCQAADYVGSTAFIIKTVTAAPAGTSWAVGTEIHLVERLAKENPDKTIFNLDRFVCLCTTMYRITPQRLAWALDNLAEGNIVNQVRVPDPIKADARRALNRMLEEVG